MRTEYVRYTPGSNLYAKPSPLATSPWSTGVVTATENGSTGEYAIASLDESTNYTVFVRSGGSPASSDIAIAQIGVVSVGSGGGARTVTITVTLDTGGNVEGATVRLTKAAESYTATTDVDGECVFNVDDGTWTVAITAAGASFAGTSLVVDGDETASYEMTAISLTASDVGKRTGYYTCYDENGVVESGVEVQCWCYYAPSTGLALDSAVRTETSDVDGLVQFTNMIVGAKYKFRRGDWAESKAVSVTVESGSGAFALDSVLGRDA